MYAPQPSPHQPQKPTQPERPGRRTGTARQAAARASRRHSHRELAQEVGIKLTVNVVLMAIALVYLGRLLSYNLSQERKLAQLQAEVAAVGDRVSQLQDEFAVQFDTHQTQQLVRQQRHRVSPNQMQIIWTTPPNAIVGAPDPPPVEDTPPASNAAVVSTQPLD